LKPYDGVHIATWHDDSARTGLNAKETLLTTSNVNVSNFGKLFSLHVDGHVYAQPLYVSSVPFETSVRNLLYVATEYDSIYAFDADEFNNDKPLWKTSLLKTGETPKPGGNPAPWIGITSTPVVDVSGKTLYAVGAFSSGERRLVAVDIETGKVRGETTIEASVPSTLPDAVNGQLTLASGCLNRAALLLSQGTIFIGFGGCAHGWLLSYDAASLKQIAALSISPNAVGYGKFPGGGGIGVQVPVPPLTIRATSMW